MRILTLAMLALSLSAAPAIAQSTWIVSGEDVSQSFTADLAARAATASPPEGNFAVSTTAGGMSVMRMDDTLETLLQLNIHEKFHRCGGYTIHPDEASARAELTNPFYDPTYLGRSGLFPSVADQQTSVEPALNLVDSSKIVATNTMLQALGTRHYQSQGGEDASTQLKAQWEAYAPTRSDYSVALFSHSWRQTSVIATITGTTDPDEVIVLGGHLDSINAADNTDAPGADDDASGIAVVSEILRVILATDFKPKKTIKFMAYAAEEVGLRGSGEISDELSADPNVDVIAALQFDMTGFAGSPNDMYFITDFVSTDLTNFTRMLISNYNGPGPHHITHGNTSCGYACSDHASWTRNGIPSAFPFEALFADYNQDIHTPDDLLSNLDPTGEKQSKFAKLGIEFAMELAKATTDAPSPPSASGNISYAWANDPYAGSYTPSQFYAYNQSDGAISGERVNKGQYRIVFQGLGDARPGANVQITGYGASSNDCKVTSWNSVEPDFVVRVQCTNTSGLPADERFTVLVTWP